MSHLPTSLARLSAAPQRGAALGGVVAPPKSAVVIAISLMAHVGGVAALSYLPQAAHAARPRFEEVAVTLSRPTPAIPDPVVSDPIPEPPPEAPPPEPREVARAAPVREARPTESAPEPTPPEPATPPAPVTAAPPSLDDVFGDPPPAPDLLAGSGSGHAVATGSGGSGSGRPGGTGAVAGGGSGGSAEGSVDDAGARRRARLAYKRELERILRSRTSYPRAALRERLEGRVELALRIGRDGSVLAARIAESSGYAILDQAAVESARSGTLPAPPEAAGLRDSDELTVGVLYRVR